LSINFVVVNPETIINNMINDFESYTGDKLYPGDQRRIFLQGIGYVIVNILNSINEAGRSNLLRYSTGERLEALGEDIFSIQKLQAEKATSKVKFVLVEAQSQNITINANTRVSPDGQLFFLTKTNLIIVSGATEGIVEVEAEQPGTVYNGFVAGQINILVDGNSYVYGVSNTTVSSGGTEQETDEEYKARCRLAGFSYSSAGPEKAYEYYAKSASNEVGDARAYKTDPGTIEIAIVKKDGVIPLTTDELITVVKNACSDKTVRPLTDSVSVVPATAVNTTINIGYYIDSSNENEVANIQSAITEAINEYKQWQTEKLNRNINPDKLRQLMYTAGASRITITAPVYTEVSVNKVAQITSTTVNYLGLE